MASIELNTGFIKTVPGILKLLECLVVFIVLLIARFGDDGSNVTWGNEDKRFLGIGSSVGYAIIVPSLILSYLLGAIPTIFEFIINLVGFILFTAMGATMVTKGDMEAVVGGIAIALGILFLVDFVYLCINRR